MRTHPSPPGKTRRRGSVIVLVTIALVAVVGSAAFVFDLGRVTIGAQYAQSTADAAAMASLALPTHGVQAPAIARATSIVTANAALSPYELAVAPSGITFYGPGDTPPTYRQLSATEEAVKVVVTGTVEFYFAGAFGLRSVPVQRTAIAARVYAAGASILPMRLSADTPLEIGQYQELHASTAGEELSSGQFGWLDPLAGDFIDLLSGEDVPRSVLQANFVTVGDIMSGYTGQSTGQWMRAMQSRLTRASQPPYDTQAPIEGEYTEDNPRLLVIPLTNYLGGMGTNARYEIVKFGVFWLESIRGGRYKSITGQFVKFTVPMSPDATGVTGVWTVRLIA